MAKAKSILEKFSDTVKGLADSASEALKADEPARADRAAAIYMPFAAEGLVSDALPVPPTAAQPARRKRRTARKTAARAKTKSASKSAPKRSVRKSARKSASAKSKQVAKTAKRKGSKRPARKARRQ